MGEELVKHLHVCDMSTIAHHAVASSSTLGERWRDGGQSNDQQVRGTCDVKPSGHGHLRSLQAAGGF
jgi:hypothetical protein